MYQFITIATFTLPLEANIIKSRLESEGIQCFLKDELTTQVYNFYSNAIGGVKLQVRASDVQRATEILSECGYQDSGKDPYRGYWQALDNFTSKLPLLNKLRIEFRALTLLGISVFVLMVIGYYLTLPR